MAASIKHVEEGRVVRVRSRRKPVGRGTRARKKDRGSRMKGEGREKGKEIGAARRGDSEGRIDGPGN